MNSLLLAVSSSNNNKKNRIQSGFGRFFIAYMEVGMSRMQEHIRDDVQDVVYVSGGQEARTDIGHIRLFVSGTYKPETCVRYRNY